MSQKIAKNALCLFGFYAVFGIVHILLSILSDYFYTEIGICIILIGICLTAASTVIPLLIKAFTHITI